MTKMKRWMRSSLRKSKKLLIFKPGSEKTELAITRESSLLRAGTASFEGRSSKRDGSKTKTFGHPTTISNGLPKYAISTI